MSDPTLFVLPMDAYVLSLVTTYVCIPGGTLYIGYTHSVVLIDPVCVWRKLSLSVIISPVSLLPPGAKVVMRKWRCHLTNSSNRPIACVLTQSINLVVHSTHSYVGIALHVGVRDTLPCASNSWE